MTNGLNKFLSLTLAVSVMVSTAAKASDEILQIRTAKVDNYRIAITPDLRLMGIECKNGDMIFSDASGTMNMVNYKTTVNRGFVARSQSIPIADSSLKVLCESPLNSEFDITISDKGVRVISARPPGQVEKFENAAMVRTFNVNGYTIGVTNNYRLIGIDCGKAMVPGLLDLTGINVSKGRIVLQNDNGTLPMELYAGGLTTPPRALIKDLTEKADLAICHGDSAQAMTELDLTGIREAQIDVSERTVNARGK